MVTKKQLREHCDSIRDKYGIDARFDERTGSVVFPVRSISGQSVTYIVGSTNNETDYILTNVEMGIRLGIECADKRRKVI